MAIPFNVHILTLLLFVSNLFYLIACNEPEVTETTSGINVSSESLVVSIGESKQVTASVFPYVEEGGGVTWTMEDLSIAALEDKGTHNGIGVATITGISEGDVTIIVTSSADESVQATITVQVVETTFENQAK